MRTTRRRTTTMTTMMAMMIRTTIKISVSQLWDLIQIWDFLKDITDTYLSKTVSISVILTGELGYFNPHLGVLAKY